MKSKIFWFGRDKKTIGVQKYYVVSENKMKIDSETSCFYGDENFCPKEFEKLTGIKIKPGQQKKVKLVIVK